MSLEGVLRLDSLERMLWSINIVFLEQDKGSGSTEFDSPLAERFLKCGPDPFVYHEISYVHHHKGYLRKEVVK